ncbi:Pectinesterase, catalytic [Corchorus olitorius]|uniref:Pectinesterase n=1 Tax=Corchorus olitorius TaxID=93759 RepID=A0A1R3K830_9ROSI|nr:Pectinesterase, catalytic [Corchorus olitorius]
MSNSDDGGRKKRIAIIAVCSFLLVAMVVAVTVGVSINDNSSVEETSNGNKNSQVSSSVKAIKSICQPTDYKKTCEEQLHKEAGNSTDINELVQAAFRAAKKFAAQAVKNSTTLRDLEKEPRAKKALDVCKQLLTYSVRELEKSFKQVDLLEPRKFDKMLKDLKIWLSATITNQQTCLDGFHNTTSEAGEKMKKALNISMQLSRNGLAIATEMAAALKQLQIQNYGRRRLLQEQGKDGIPILGHTNLDLTSDIELNNINRRLLQVDEFDNVPILGHNEWASEVEMPAGVRRLMQAQPNSTIQHDVVVAKDGSGHVTTIKAAMERIPLNSQKPFVIYIKEGVYEENLEFSYQMINVVLIGDGKEKTRITGRLNNAEGVPTFRTATVAINGDFFSAKNIGFENSAGPTKYQAVALLVLSDMSVFYNCSMDGYQDTLYVHSKRQFYRDCDISGTIDFVFGDAAVVFQSCNFLVRKPLDNQQNAVTAHGRFDVREPTAIVIQNSTIKAAPEFESVKGNFLTYLGRPWGNFSRTIIMESYLDSMIAPEGWAIWDGPWGLDTCFYSEFNNHGPGADKSKRVTWVGIKRIFQAAAHGYTAGKFIDGDSWIQAKNVPYTGGFTNSSSVRIRGQRTVRSSRMFPH